MKFMKLGSKPDAFQADANCVRFVLSELATDVVISVGELKFHLHKFPLLSKSNKLQKLVSKMSQESHHEIQLVNFPGGLKAFEICAKFCYGMVVTLNPYNVVAARCAAEYLEMTEDVDGGNLIFKIDVFLNSSIFRSWKDSIIVLQTTNSLLPWPENLKVIGRCIDSIASKTSFDPLLVSWPYTYNRKLATSKEMTPSRTEFREKTEHVPKDWWIEDVCDLDIDLFKRVMIAVKLKGRTSGGIICEALKTYATRWLPDTVDLLVSEVHVARNRVVVETIISFLPSDRSACCSCSFLLKLLKAAILVGVDDDSGKENLIRSIGLKLDEASVNDLLIPARSPQTTIYDVGLVQHLVDQFTMNVVSRDSKITEENSANDSEFVSGHGPWLKVGKMVDGYLAAIAHDPNLSVISFIELSQAISNEARPIHDRLYGAVDIYLKEHQILTKADRKDLCGIINVKKLTTEASMHAAQNEQLPLRVVVQVLFFEQARAASAMHTLSTGHNTIDAPRNDHTNPENRKSLRRQMDDLKIKEEEELLKTGKLTKRGSKNTASGVKLLPSRSRRIFDKLWIIGKWATPVESKSSETSASSQSPVSMIQGDMNLARSVSRQRRYSIS